MFALQTVLCLLPVVFSHTLALSYSGHKEAGCFIIASLAVWVNCFTLLCSAVKNPIEAAHHTRSHSSLQFSTAGMTVLQISNLCHILPGAVFHQSDIVTLWRANLAGISVELLKVLYNPPINYSSRGARTAAWRSCAVSSSSGFCVAAIPSGLYASSTSQSELVLWLLWERSC